MNNYRLLTIVNVVGCPKKELIVILL